MYKSSIDCFVHEWLRQKYYAPQVRSNRDSNPWPPDRDSTFYFPRTPILTIQPPGTSMKYYHIILEVWDEFKCMGSKIDWFTGKWYFLFKHYLDRSTMHPKFNLNGFRTTRDSEMMEISAFTINAHYYFKVVFLIHSVTSSSYKINQDSWGLPTTCS